jgi:hypothetical protein
VLVLVLVLVQVQAQEVLVSVRVQVRMWVLVKSPAVWTPPWAPRRTRPLSSTG